MTAAAFTIEDVGRRARFAVSSGYLRITLEREADHQVIVMDIKPSVANELAGWLEELYREVGAL